MLNDSKLQTFSVNEEWESWNHEYGSREF